MSNQPLTYKSDLRISLREMLTLVKSQEISQEPCQNKWVVTEDICVDTEHRCTDLVYAQLHRVHALKERIDVQLWYMHSYRE